MKSTISFTDKYKNSYWSDVENGRISLCHPMFYSVVEKMGNQDVEKNDADENWAYYVSKYNFLKENGFWGEMKVKDNFILTSEKVKYELANTSQLVFEVTDSCNLQCRYCFYSDLYGGHDIRHSSNMSFDSIQLFLSYMDALWESPLNTSPQKIIYISFYGGEPLLNIPFITQVVDLFKKRKDASRFVFSMTTNGILLNRYIEYLVDNNFNLLVSLDGKENNNIYRVNKLGRNSFFEVYDNLKKIQLSYPAYFAENVNISTVLHNANSVSDVYSFFKSEFNKKAKIIEMNNVGIQDDKKEKFDEMYKNIVDSLHQSEKYLELEYEMFENLYTYVDLTIFLHKYSGNVYKLYNELLHPVSHVSPPTGTCFPFSRKVFITVNGKILPCETVDHKFHFGTVKVDELSLDLELIATEYNRYYDQFLKICNSCYRKKMCKQCLFKFQSLEHPICLDFLSVNDVKQVFSNYISFFTEHPSDYERIMKEMIIG